MKKAIIAVALLIVCASCGGRQKPANAATGDTHKKIYEMPRIPAMISEPLEQAEYFAQHYWDNFDFADTVNIDNPDYTEQAFTNYVQVLLNIPRETGDASIAAMFRKARAGKEIFLHFADLAEKYLYDPNSPFRDEEYYITVLESVLANPALDQWERIRPQEQLRMALKNRVGTTAADFRYTLGSGESGTLHKIKSPYTLVFINNPGCPACRDTQAQIENSQFLTQLIDEGVLTVLAIYPDEDLAEWHKHASEIPASWINSYDKELKMKKDELYDLKAIPTLYLLDSDKTVMLKDVMSIPLIEQTIYDAGL